MWHYKVRNFILVRCDTAHQWGITYMAIILAKELGLHGNPRFSPVAVPHTSVRGTSKEQMYTYSQKFGATAA